MAVTFTRARTLTTRHLGCLTLDRGAEDATHWRVIPEPLPGQDMGGPAGDLVVLVAKSTGAVVTMSHWEGRERVAGMTPVLDTPPGSPLPSRA